MESIDRRTYVKSVGAAGLLALTTTAGCAGGDGGDGEDGGDGDGDDGGDVTTLTAGTAPGFPPFEMKEGGDLVGFDIDLLEAVVENAEGYELEGWEEFEFDSLTPALQNENIDVIAAAMTITEDRDETVDFSEPYYSADQAVLVADDSDFAPEQLDDLEGRELGAQSGTTGETVIDDELIAEGLIDEDNYNSYGNYVLAVEDLVNGNIDAVVLDTPVANTFEADRPVSIAFVYETGEEYGFAVREGDESTQSALNSGLEAVNDSGQYDEITRTWFQQED